MCDVELSRDDWSFCALLAKSPSLAQFVSAPIVSALGNDATAMSSAASSSLSVPAAASALAPRMRHTLLMVTRTCEAHTARPLWAAQFWAACGAQCGALSFREVLPEKLRGDDAPPRSLFSPFAASSSSSPLPPRSPHSSSKAPLAMSALPSGGGGLARTRLVLDDAAEHAGAGSLRTQLGGSSQPAAADRDRGHADEGDNDGPSFPDAQLAEVSGGGGLGGGEKSLLDLSLELEEY